MTAWAMRLLTAQTLRYAAVGLVSAMAYSSIMIAGDWAGFSYAVMSTVSFAIVTPFGYLVHSGFTFTETLSFKAFLRFVSGAAAGFPLSLATMAVLCSGLGLPVALAAPLATVILFGWNYLSARWAIKGLALTGRILVAAPGK